MSTPRSEVLSLALVTALIALPTRAEAGVPMSFPARADGLPPNTYIDTAGHNQGGKQDFAIDYGRWRWDTNAQVWTRWKEGATAPYDTTEHTTFGLPVYAPEDGEVIACFHNYVDSSDPATNPCPSGTCPDNIFGAGNFVLIRSLEGDHAVLIAHLAEDSLPPEVCPNAATTTSNATQDCDLSPSSDWEGYPVSTELAPPYPQIHKGDYLGDIGMTGNSWAPHGHFEVFEVQWDSNNRLCRTLSQPIELYETWYQAKAGAPSSSWIEMDGDVVQAGNSIIMVPDPIGVQRDAHAFNHGASELHVAPRGDSGVMAYLDASGRLELRSYDLDANGGIVTQAKRDEGTVLDLSVARPGSTRSVVVSIRGANGALKLIPYSVTTNGAISRLYGKEVSEGIVGLVSSVPSPIHDGVVVAVETQAGDLKLIDYHTDGALNISRDYTSTGTGGLIDAVELTGLSLDFDGVVTAELDPGGNLRLRSFEVPASGGVFNADTHYTLVAGTEVRVDTVPVTWWGVDEYVVSSVRQLDGTLRVDAWDVDANGDITWLSGDTAGAVGSIDGASAGIDDYLATVRDAGGKLRLIGWALDGDGQLRRNATRTLSAVSEAISVVTPSDHIVTIATDGGGDLQLLSLDENFSYGL